MRVCNTSLLEAVAIDVTGTPNRFGFATGRSQDTEVLVISLASSAEVRLLQVPDGESLSMRLLRVIGGGGNRLLWRAGLLFIATWDAQADSDEVSVWHVSGGGRRVERCGPRIKHADNLNIQCWSAVRESLSICDV